MSIAYVDIDMLPMLVDMYRDGQLNVPKENRRPGDFSHFGDIVMCFEKLTGGKATIGDLENLYTDFIHAYGPPPTDPVLHTLALSGEGCAIP